MFTIECTRKLLGRLNRLPSGGGAEPTTRLGHWCASIVPLGGREVVLLVNMRSLLPVLVPVTPADVLLGAFRKALADVLGRLEVPPATVLTELREMTDVRLTRTTSRRVLGSMTDFSHLARAYPDAKDLTEVALKLADSPCSPIGMRSPGRVAKELLEAGE